MSEAVAADDRVGFRAPLSSALLSDARRDDAITVAEPGFGRHDCSELLWPFAPSLLRSSSTDPQSCSLSSTIPSRSQEVRQSTARAAELYARRVDAP
ncbi:hypothetical protein [Streptomyces roseolus]|uniref:hypothetical protein n=1 Tax=Streptomyces roseolus TaxID=67358 RepID=UPI003659A99D